MRQADVGDLQDRLQLQPLTLEPPPRLRHGPGRCARGAGARLRPDLPQRTGRRRAQAHAASSPRALRRGDVPREREGRGAGRVGRAPACDQPHRRRRPGGGRRVRGSGLRRGRGGSCPAVSLRARGDRRQAVGHPHPLPVRVRSPRGGADDRRLHRAGARPAHEAASRRRERRDRRRSERRHRRRRSLPVRRGAAGGARDRPRRQAPHGAADDRDPRGGQAARGHLRRRAPGREQACRPTRTTSRWSSRRRPSRSRSSRR